MRFWFLFRVGSGLIHYSCLERLCSGLDFDSASDFSSSSLPGKPRFGFAFGKFLF